MRESIKGIMYSKIRPDTLWQSSWYLKNVDHRNIRTLTRFRLRNHRLAIETGSWFNIENNCRNCLNCDELEDEEHFVLHWRNYMELQNKYVFLDNNRPDNLVTIWNSICKRTLDNLAIYIRKAQAIHQQVAEAWLELNMNELVDLTITVTWFIEWYLFIYWYCVCAPSFNWYFWVTTALSVDIRDCVSVLKQ